MKKDIIYFFNLFKFNLKNAFALKGSFFISVFSMMLNNSTFFIIWYLFSSATGPINGWTSFDIFGMLGVAMLCFGITHGFFYGTVDLPEIVTRGKFDTVLLSPRSILSRLSGMSFSIIALGDILLGLIIVIWYGLINSFNFNSWIIYIFIILLGSIIFLCIRILVGLIVFYVYDGELISGQVFEIFLRPGLYPGSMFTHKMKIIFMTVIPVLITSSVGIDFLKTRESWILYLAILSTLFWTSITYLLFKKSIKRYESGNFLR